MLLKATHRKKITVFLLVEISNKNGDPYLPCQGKVEGKKYKKCCKLM